MALASCLVALASCLVALVSCLVVLVSCLVTLGSCLVALVAARWPPGALVCGLGGLHPSDAFGGVCWALLPLGPPPHYEKYGINKTFSRA